MWPWSRIRYLEQMVECWKAESILQERWRKLYEEIADGALEEMENLKKELDEFRKRNKEHP